MLLILIIRCECESWSEKKSYYFSKNKLSSRDVNRSWREPSKKTKMQPMRLTEHAWQVVPTTIWVDGMKKPDNFRTNFFNSTGEHEKKKKLSASVKVEVTYAHTILCCVFSFVRGSHTYVIIVLRLSRRIVGWLVNGSYRKRFDGSTANFSHVECVALVVRLIRSSNMHFWAQQQFRLHWATAKRFQRNIKVP